VILLVQVFVLVDGAKLLTVSTTFLLFHRLSSKITHIRMVVSEGRNSWSSENFVVTVNTFYLYYDIQSVRTVQGCKTVLYKPGNWCYIYIKNISLQIKFIYIAP